MPKSLETIDGEFHKWWESLDPYRRHDIDRQSARSGWRAREWQELESAEPKDDEKIRRVLFDTATDCINSDGTKGE